MNFIEKFVASVGNRDVHWLRSPIHFMEVINEDDDPTLKLILVDRSLSFQPPIVK